MKKVTSKIEELEVEMVIVKKRVEIPVVIPSFEIEAKKPERVSMETQTMERGEERDEGGEERMQQTVANTPPPPPDRNRGREEEDTRGEAETTNRRERGEVPPPPPEGDAAEETEIGEDYREEEVVRRFAAVNNRQDLEETIRWVKTLRMENNTVEINTPLIRAMKTTGRWPGRGTMGCYRCEHTARSTKALSIHVRNEHGYKAVNFRWQEQIEYVVGKTMRWECRGGEITQPQEAGKLPILELSIRGHAT